MPETIRQAVKRARRVFVFVDDGYDDYISAMRVPVSKKVALELIRRAPKEYLPEADWEGDELTLTPQAWRGHG